MNIEKLTVINTQGDFFTVEVSGVSNEGILTIWLNPKDDDLQSEMHTVDLLNENIIEYLKDESYKVLFHNDVK